MGSDLDWFYGPTPTDPDAGKRWHRDCGGEVLWLDGDICSKCGAVGGDPSVTDQGAEARKGSGS